LLKRCQWCVPFVALILASYAVAASAQDAYPSKPISLIVPWPAGAGTDVVQRAAARLVEAQLGRSIVVFNKPGAAGVIGAREIENAAPDGYTLGGIASTVLLTQYTVPNPTDWKKYQAIATLTYDPAAIAVRTDSPWKSLKELIDHAKSRPGVVTVGNSGMGGFHHVFSVVLEEAAGIKVNHIPFKGGTEIVLATLSGQLDAASADTSALYSQVQSGKLRLLGLASKTRHPMFPDVPTYAEQGIDIDIGVRRLVVAPRGTPAPIVAKLEQAYLKAAADPQFTKLKGGWVIDAKNAADTATAMENDDRRLSKIIDRAGLRVTRQ
jgi:tripartite-type tricarboxylate transporter receptor subunit TctC